MFDDPMPSATAPLDLVIWVLLVSLIVAVPLLIVFTLSNWSKLRSDRRYFVGIGVFAVGLLAVWTLAYYDPGRVWAWFLD